MWETEVVDRDRGACVDDIVVRLGAKGDFSPGAWNAFAISCGGSYLCSYEYTGLRGWKKRVKLAEYILLRDGRETKIGQCVLITDAGVVSFCDALQILPRYERFWSAIMTATLKRLGPGRYRYGSSWHLEPDRSDDLRTVASTRLLTVERHAVQFVDFGDWPDWDAYWRSVSMNVRRNANRFAGTGAVVDERGPLGGWAFNRAFYRARRDLVLRKGLRKSVPYAMLRMLARGLFLRKHVRLMSAECGGEKKAFYQGVRFGANTYYVEGASRGDNGGGSWLLLKSALRDAFETSSGKGRFVFGHNPLDRIGTDETWEPLLLSRRQCRVKDLGTSTFTFAYDGPA